MRVLTGWRLGRPAAARRTVGVITGDELQAALAGGGVLLVEALPAVHYDQGHLPGAHNVPGVLSADQAAALAPDLSTTVVVYCSGPACGRSKVTAEAFSALGYRDVRVYPGGKADWVAAGLPLHTTSPA